MGRYNALCLSPDAARAWVGTSGMWTGVIVGRTISSAASGIAGSTPVADEGDPDRARIFAEEYVVTGDAERAARRAGWLDTRYPIRVWARKLLEDPGVKLEILLARATGLTHRPVEEHSREAVLEDLDEIREGAVGDGAWSAATGAVTTKARILGFMDTTVNLRITDARQLPLEQLRAMVAALTLPAPEPTYAEFEEIPTDG